MLNRVTFSQVDSTDEIARELNILIDNFNLMETKVCQLNEQVGTFDNRIDNRVTKSWLTKYLSPKKKKKGSVLMKTLVSLVILLILCGVCFGQDEWPITYDTVSTPNQLVQLLRNRFSNQSGNYFTFGPTTTAPPHSEGRVYYNDSSNVLQLSTGTAWLNIDTAGGVTLDSAYDYGSAGSGRTINVLDGAVLLTSNEADTNAVLSIAHSAAMATDQVVLITKSGAGDMPCIEFENTGGGYDIEGTGALWSMSKTGTAIVAGITVGASDITLTNSETIDNDDNGEITFGDGVDDTAISWSGTTLQFTTDTSVDTVSWGDLDAHTGLSSLTFDAGSTGLITLVSDSAADDLTISQTGSADGSVVITSAGTAANAIDINTTAGGIDIDISGAADGEDFAVNTDSSVQLTASQAAVNAIKLNASAGGFDIDGTALASTITQTATGAADDLTISVAGAFASSLIMTSAGTGTDAIDIDATAGGIDIDVTGAATHDFNVTNTGGSIVLSASEDVTDAVDIDATAGGIDIDAAGEAGQDIVITNTGGSIGLSASEAATDAISITASAGGITMASQDVASVWTHVPNGTTDDLTISVAPATSLDSSLILTSAGSGTDALTITTVTNAGDISIVSNDKITTTTVGTYSVTAAADDMTFTINTSASGGEDLSLIVDGDDDCSIILDSDGTGADAIKISASNAAGGIDINAGTGNIDVDITTGDFLVDCDLISIDGTGTSNITVTADAGSEDFTIAQAGSQDSNLILSSAGTAADALQITTSAGGIDITVAGAADGEDLDIASNRSIALASSEATVDAIKLNASAGGFDIDGTAEAATITQTATGNDDDLTISVAGAHDASLLLSSAGTGTDALSLTTVTNAGDIVINSNDKIDMDSTGTFALNVAADTLLIQVDSDGTGNDDLTLNVDGDDDAHILISSDGTSINTISLLESGTGTGGGILIRADTGTGAADGVASVQLLSDVGGIGIKAGVDDTDAIDIDASVGSVDIDGAKNVTINAGTDITIQVDSTTSGDDLLIRVDGDDDSHITLDSDGTSIDTIYLHQSGSNTAAGIKIHADTGIAYADGVASIQLLSDDGGVAISAGVAQANAINIDAGAGGVDVDAALQINIASSQAAATAIVINASNAAGGIDIDAKEDINILLTASATGEDILIATGGDQDSQIIITADGSAENAFYVLCDAGNIDLIGQGASGEDFDIESTNSALNLSSGEATDDAISIQASAGGLDLDGAKSIHISSSESAIDAIYIHASAGGIDITAASGGGGEDIDIITTGNTDNHIKIISSGTTADALYLQASAGGIDIDGGAGGDVTVDTSKSILLTSTEAVSDSIGLTATGNITLTTTHASGILINTATFEHKAKYYAISPGPTAATEIEVVGGTGLTCVGLAAGVAEIGSTEGYVEYDDAADFIRYAICLPDDFVDTGTQADLIITWDIHEQHAGGGDTNVDIDVNIYEYDGSANTTALVTDTIDVADTVGRALNGLVTLSGGIGDDAELQAGDVLIFELTGTADTDDFNLYGMKLSYRVGLQATE